MEGAKKHSKILSFIGKMSSIISSAALLAGFFFRDVVVLDVLFWLFFAISIIIQVRSMLEE